MILRNITVHAFSVDPTLIGMAALDATGRRKFVDEAVVEAMPRAVASSGQIFFFRVPQVLNQGDPEFLAKAIGLRLVDPHTLSAFIAENDDNRDIATIWEKDGKSCYAAFSRRIRGRGVLVRQRDRSWANGWWFAGYRVERAA